MAASALLASACGTLPPPNPTPTTTTAPPRPTLAADRMVFDSLHDGNGEIYSVRVDGAASTIVQLTQDDNYDSMWARVSPDRTRILFHRNPAGGVGNQYELSSLWVMDADGSNVRMLMRPVPEIGWGLAGHAEWSPDGQSIVLAGSSAPNTPVNLWLLDAQTGAITRQLTHFAAPVGGLAIDPSWSPDGTRILFVGCLSGACLWNEQDIYSLELATGAITRHTTNTIAEWDPFFSADGTMVAWNQQPAFTPQPHGVWDILVAGWNPAGTLTNQRKLVADGGINGTTEWSADGSSIIFHRFTPTTGYRLYNVNVATGAFTLLPLGNDWYEVFSPDRGAAGH